LISVPTKLAPNQDQSYAAYLNIYSKTRVKQSTSIGKESAANARSSATRGFKPSAVARS